jgi:spermidine synthase
VERPAPGELRLIYYAEGWTANVAVAEEVNGVRSLLLNGKPDASNVPTGDMRTQLLLGHLPALMAERAGDALVIGLGSGVTAGALSTHGMRSIDCVEIEQKVAEASEYFREENRGVLHMPNFKLIVDDARNVVQHRQAQYDIITSEPSNLWMSGVANLFTQEFFQATRKRLRPGGILCQWLHLYQISPHDVLIFLKTIHSVYPHLAVWVDGSDMLVLGSDRPIVLDRERISQRLSVPAVRDSLAPSGIDASNLYGLYVTDERIVKVLRKTLPLNTDDHPVLEFSAPRSLFLNQSRDIVRSLYELWRIASESEM